MRLTGFVFVIREMLLGGQGEEKEVRNLTLVWSGSRILFQNMYNYSSAARTASKMGQYTASQEESSRQIYATPPRGCRIGVRAITERKTGRRKKLSMKIVCVRASSVG